MPHHAPTKAQQLYSRQHTQVVRQTVPLTAALLGPNVSCSKSAHTRLRGVAHHASPLDGPPGEAGGAFIGAGTGSGEDRSTRLRSGAFQGNSGSHSGSVPEATKGVSGWGQVSSTQPDVAPRPRPVEKAALTNWSEKVKDAEEALESLEKKVKGKSGRGKWIRGAPRQGGAVAPEWQSLRDGLGARADRRDGRGTDDFESLQGDSDDEDDEEAFDDEEEEDDMAEEDEQQAQPAVEPRADFTTMNQEFEELMVQSQTENLNIQHIERMFPFPLDGFQKEAVEKSIDGKSVVVCAPTGAGKTVIAVAAAVPVLAAGQRVIYTTPLKALSNQKLYELQEVFGEDRVGLRTGDVSVNPGAPIMIMTTEILRNISYRTLLEGDPLSSFSPNLGDVALTVLDEVHYLGHPDRGSVWEEIIINCPAHMKLLAMSATVANPGEIGDWIQSVHGACDTVQTSFRPVPLKWWFAWGQPDASRDSSTGSPSWGSNNGGSDAEDGGKGRRMQRNNWRASSANARVQVEELLERRKTRQGKIILNSVVDRSLKSAKQLRAQTAAVRRKLLRGSSKQAGYDALQQLQQKLARIEQAQQASPVEPDMTKLVLALSRADFLPAIYFVFSRKRCNEYAVSMGATFSSSVERQEILAHLNELRSTQPDAIPKELEEPLLNGVASHHAGLLPGWKGLVETLFQKGLIKVVFATETLAAGINMPARTTVISSISRRRNGEYAALPHNDLLQMAGRAGRRGYDTQGHCIISQTRFEGARAAYSIIARGPEQIMSQFSISYGMVLNLLSTRNLQDCEHFLARSFLRFQTAGNVEETIAQAQRLDSEAESMLREMEGGDGDLFKKYEAASAQLLSYRNALKVTRSQALTVRGEAAVEILQMTKGGSGDGAFASFQAALSDAGNDKSAGWSGSSAFTSSIDADSDHSTSRSTQSRASQTSASAFSEEYPKALSGKPADISISGESIDSPSTDSLSSSTDDEELSAVDSNGAEAQVGNGLADHSMRMLDSCSGVLVTIDASKDGYMETELLAAVCLGRISKVADFEIPPGPNLQRNRRIYSQEDLLACLAADNRLYLLRPTYLAAVHWREPLKEYLVTASTPVPSAALKCIKDSLFEAAVVRWSGGDMGMVCAGSTKTAKIAYNLSKHIPEPTDFLLEGSGWPEAVFKAKQEYKLMKKDTRAIEREVRKLKQQFSYRGRNSKEGPAAAAMQLKSRAKQLRRKARNMQSSVEWNDVVSTVEVLSHCGALVQSDVDKEGEYVGEEAGWFELQNLGMIARDIRFENELWLAMILENPALEGIKPSTLAGLLCALITPFQVSRPEVVVALDPSDDLQLLVEELAQDAVHLASVQAQKGIMCPIEIDLKMAGLVEAWTWNVEWEDLKESCELDDGDIARLLCRVADLLRQIASATAVKESLRSISRTAYKRIYRQPICDLLGL